MVEKVLKILLVEDDLDSEKIAEYMLSKMEDEMVLTHFTTLAGGLEHLETSTPDIVLLDLNLPDSNGLETVEKVIAKANNVPIVVLTALNDKEVAVNAVKAGAQDYLLKGEYDSRLLQQTIRYAIARASR